jgi:hypothetical protein
MPIKEEYGPIEHMSIRDYMATHIAAGLAANCTDEWESLHTMSRWAYKMADVLLEVRHERKSMAG